MYLHLKYRAKFSGKCVFLQSTVCCRGPAGGEARNNRYLPCSHRHLKTLSGGISWYSPRSSPTSLKGLVCSFAAEKGKCIYYLLSSLVSLVQLLLQATFGPLAENNSLQWTFLGTRAFGGSGGGEP